MSEDTLLYGTGGFLLFFGVLTVIYMVAGVIVGRKK